MRITLILVLIAYQLVDTSPTDAQISARNSSFGKALIAARDSAGETAKVGINIFDLQASFPLLIRQNEESKSFVFLLNTLAFRRQDFSYQWPKGDTGYRPDRVFGLSYGLNLIRSLGPQWLGIAFATAGLYSDLEDVGSDDFLGEGGLLLVRKFGEHWQLGAGPIFTYAFGNPVWIPAPYVRYRSSSRYSIDIRPPLYATLRYRLNARTQVDLALRSLFNNYHLGDRRARDLNNKGTSIAFSDITFGLETKTELKDMLALEFGLATTLNRTLEINDHQGDPLNDLGLQDTWSIFAGLSFGPE